MDTLTKLTILSDAAKYDVSCSSSGSSRKNSPGGTGSCHVSGICHSWSNDGRCISLLKILFTNHCIYNCSYCINRTSSDVKRALFTPEEVADLTMNFYKRNYIEGLFLSSAVYINPDYTMELLIKTVRLLRDVYKFNGYIHLKAIPGANSRLIFEAGRLADRMSVNIELPSIKSLKLLAPEKSEEAIIKPMSFISSSLEEGKEYGSKNQSRIFLPAGQTTQLIVGATPESDLKILKLSENLYKSFSLKRVYYSAYIPVSNNPNLPVISSPPLLREHRLYQADWLLRFYGFKALELLDERHPDFDTELDPKSNWALNNLHLFPIEINTADYTALLRVPGIGVRSAGKIVTARKAGHLYYEDLKKFGIVLKRARHFITCRDKYYGEASIDEALIRNLILPGKISNVEKNFGVQQLSIFSMIPDVHTSITGEF